MPASKKRLEEIATIPDSDIDYSDIAELGPEFWKNTKVVFPQPKKTVTIRIDSDVLDWFKKEGKGYQSRMNAVLRSFMDSLESGGR
jgi:uncharacterized protein (DUF4415 family)